jgi:hypothetical protein
MERLNPGAFTLPQNLADIRDRKAAEVVALKE